MKLLNKLHIILYIYSALIKIFKKMSSSFNRKWIFYIYRKANTLWWKRLKCLCYIYPVIYDRLFWNMNSFFNEIISTLTFRTTPHVTGRYPNCYTNSSNSLYDTTGMTQSLRVIIVTKWRWFVFILYYYSRVSVSPWLHNGVKVNNF